MAFMHAHGHNTPDELAESARVAVTMPASERVLDIISAYVRDAIFIKNLDRQYIYVNAAAAEMMGRPVHEIIGKMAEDVFSVEDARQIREVDDLNLRGLPVNVTKKMSLGGCVAYLQTSQNPVYNDQHEICGISGIVKNVTENVRAEQTIKRLLDEKTRLLKEAHHRIKNNIAAIGGMLNLQAAATQNDDARRILRDAVGRVESVRLIYDKLLVTDDCREVYVKNYLMDLLAAIRAIFPEKGRVMLTADLASFNLDAQKLFSLGVIINELITNSAKHAFGKRAVGNIHVALSKNGPTVTLVVKDDGGDPPAPSKLEGSSGFGLKLVRIFVAQLKGSVLFENQNGLCCTVRFDVT